MILDPLWLLVGVALGSVLGCVLAAIIANWLWYR